LIGMREWQDIAISASFSLPGSGANLSACLGTRVDQMWANGIVLCISAQGNYTLSVGGPSLGGSPQGQVYLTGTLAALAPGVWHNMSLATVAGIASAHVNGRLLFDHQSVRDIDTGFAAIGANDWFPIMFDNVRIETAGSHWTPPTPERPVPKVGDALHGRRCAANGLIAEDQHFQLLPDWGIRHPSSGLCVSASSGADVTSLTLAECNPRDSLQQFRNDYTRIRDTTQPLTVKIGEALLLLTGNVNGDVSVAPKNKLGGANTWQPKQYWQAWSYFPNTKQLRNQYTADTKLGYPMCLSIGASLSVPHYIV